MADVTKITENELQRISLIKKESLEIASILGELNYQKTLIDLQLDGQKQRIVQLRKDEEKLFADLKENYGNISINLETGEYSVVE
jgi:hypothetical protein